jgi:hypothetical protein
MPKLPMTFACGLYDRMTALYTVRRWKPWCGS